MLHPEMEAAWRSARPRFTKLGVDLDPNLKMFTPEQWREDDTLAFDAIPALSTDPNSAVPAILTTMIDPQVFHVLFAPNMAAKILGEMRRGTWLDDVIMFPIAEATGETSSYGDYNENGSAGVNTNWPQRQNYLFQVIKQYGERELERAGLARINWVSEIDIAAALALNKFLNYTYFFGVQALQNYGLLNDPHLGASLTPAPKAAGGTAWINSSGVPVATANEVYTDIQTLFNQLVVQSGGLVTQETPMVLAMSPSSGVALTNTNSFNVNVEDLLKKNFKNIRLEKAVQYGVLSAANPQGVAAGNFVQLIAPEIEGQKTGFCAYSEKLKSHPIIRLMSAFRQKQTAGSWGAVLRATFPIASMVGV
jgi:hypothetical protein